MWIQSWSELTWGTKLWLRRCVWRGGGFWGDGVLQAADNVRQLRRVLQGLPEELSRRYMGRGLRMTMATRQTLVEKYAVLYTMLADKLSGGSGDGGGGGGGTRRLTVRRALQ